MRDHRVEQGLVADRGIVQPQFLVRRPFLPHQFSDRQTRAGDQLRQQKARRRAFLIVDDVRLDTGIADQREDVARRAASGIVVDDDVHRRISWLGLGAVSSAGAV
jgi:hypothetical protein